MKIYRPLWSDGAFLAPQQFQQQARWNEHVADMVAGMGISHPWGVVAAEFDDAALVLSRLNATRLVVRFQDGTIVDTDLADNLPPVCDLSAANGSEAVEVVAALPLLSASGGNLDNGQDSERPRRWKAERVVVQELAGHESGELAILRHALTLRLSGQENTAYLTCPVARLVRNAQGQWCRDPRTLADYVSLRDEMSKLTHPARPDVNWPHAETLCLSLFEHNGVELQTAAWYTLARTHLSGLYGMNEGLAIMDALLSRQWGNIWPQPMHARMEIISSLSKRLQQVMRTLTLSYADLSQLYQAEAYLNALGDVLQRLELKHTSQLDDLRILIHNAAVRLENSENAGVSLPGEAVSLAQADRVKRVYVIEPDPQPHVQMETESPAPVKPWKPFIAGMLSMLLLSGSTVLGWQIMHKPDPAQMQFAATLAPLPAALSDEQIRFFRQSIPSPDTGIRQTQQQLTRLVQLKPDWAISYGDELLKQALTLWPEQAKPLVQQWQRQIAIAALPEDNLNGWHQGMTQLGQLAKRLNALDEQRGKYMTVSELKSAVFAMSQSFNSAVPVEEQLRQLSTLPQNQPWPAALQSQTEQHLQQLITRYAALKQKTVE